MQILLQDSKDSFYPGQVDPVSVYPRVGKAHPPGVPIGDDCGTVVVQIELNEDKREDRVGLVKQDQLSQEPKQEGIASDSVSPISHRVVSVVPVELKPFRSKPDRAGVRSSHERGEKLELRYHLTGIDL